LNLHLLMKELNVKLRKWLVIGMVAVFLAAFPAMSQAQNVVVPNVSQNTEGNYNNGFPFNVGDFGFTTQRYQQVYASSQFSSITSPTFITAITFRPDGDSGNSFSQTITNIQINLSTTSAGVGSLSFTFADNVGGNDAVVHSGALSISSSFTGGNPRDFDIVINLQTPFLYDPSAGNLLMDVRNFSGEITTQFDASDDTGTMSRLFTASSGVNSLVGDIDDESGLVTQFTFAAVPVPTTWALMGLAISGAGGLLWKQRRAAARKKALRFCKTSR